MKSQIAARLTVFAIGLSGIALLSHYLHKPEPIKMNQKLTELQHLQASMEKGGAFGHYEAGRLTVISENAADGIKPQADDTGWMISELNAHAQSTDTMDIKRRQIIMLLMRGVTQTSGFDSHSNHLLVDALAQYLQRDPLEAAKAAWVLGGINDPRITSLLTPLKSSTDAYLRRNVAQALKEQRAWR